MDSEEQTLRELVRIDWVYAYPYDLIHGVREATYDVENWCLTEVTFACGQMELRASIPGIFERMSVRRCPACCAALGLPEGEGSPKNDKECRRLLGLDP